MMASAQVNCTANVHADKTTEVKILSMNNSLIERNNQYAVFDSIASAMGKKSTWVHHTMLGKTLMDHYNSPDAKSLVAKRHWTHIILQEQSTLPRTDFKAFSNDVATWLAYIHKYCTNHNVVVIIPMNWALNVDSFAHFTKTNAKLYHNYMAIARKYGVTICPVGLAYEKIYEGEGADYTATLFSDNRHPTPKATYLAACMEYGLIFGVDPTTITYVPKGVSESDASLLRKYAK